MLPCFLGGNCTGKYRSSKMNVCLTHHHQKTGGFYLHLKSSKVMFFKDEFIANSVGFCVLPKVSRKNLHPKKTKVRTTIYIYISTISLSFGERGNQRPASGEKK